MPTYNNVLSLISSYFKNTPIPYNTKSNTSDSHSVYIPMLIHTHTIQNVLQHSNLFTYDSQPILPQHTEKVTKNYCRALLYFTSRTIRASAQLRTWASTDGQMAKNGQAAAASAAPRRIWHCAFLIVYTFCILYIYIPTTHSDTLYIIVPKATGVLERVCAGSWRRYGPVLLMPSGHIDR